MTEQPDTIRRNQALARAIRPQIFKLARQGRAVDAAFKVTRAALYPEASPSEIAAMRVMFFAGAAELVSLQLYGVTEGDDVTEQDEMLYTQLMDEIERHHGGTIALALMRYGETAQ
jgi:hypothetical protein